MEPVSATESCFAVPAPTTSSMSEYASADHAQEVTRDLSARQEESAQRVRQERIGAACLKRTRAFGKLILFGEHFVVYKAPALVGAVAAYTDCDVEFTGAPGIEVVDLRPAVPGYKVEKAAEGEEAVKIVLSHLGVDTEKRGAKITFGGSLTAVSGIGASAAQVVSLARALSAALPRTLSEEEVNAAGCAGEMRPP